MLDLPYGADVEVAREGSAHDANLIQLGRELDDVATQLDAAISDPTRDVTDDCLDQLGRIEAEILGTQSHSMESSVKITDFRLGRPEAA